RPIALGVEIRCKCDLLTLGQLLELHALESALIEEELLAIRRNCSKAAVPDQPGNGSVRHVSGSGKTDASVTPSARPSRARSASVDHRLPPLARSARTSSITTAEDLSRSPR